MTPTEIHTQLNAIRESFPKSSKMFLGFIERADKTGAFEGSTHRGAVIAMKNAWQLENRAPTVSFSPTDEKVIEYVRKAAADAQQSPCKLMVVIDMAANATQIWLMPKGGPCFIATAACGDPFAPEVLVLSAFRDNVLLRRRGGQVFVRILLFNLTGASAYHCAFGAPSPCCDDNHREAGCSGDTCVAVSLTEFCCEVPCSGNGSAARRAAVLVAVSHLNERASMCRGVRGDSTRFPRTEVTPVIFAPADRAHAGHPTVAGSPFPRERATMADCRASS
jgi:hypothetical protein